MKISKDNKLADKRFQLPTQLESITIVEQHIDELCNNYNIAEKCYGNMLIAVTEAVNNAILHGNKKDNSKQIILSYILKSDQLVFEVTDEGKGFDFDNIPDPTDPENIEKINGRGIFLMKNLADKVEFNEPGNTVKLSFYSILDE